MCKVVEITIKLWEKIGVEVVVFNSKMGLNEINIKGQLKQSDLTAVTLQNFSERRKQTQELQDCGNYQPCRRLLEETFAM